MNWDRLKKSFGSNKRLGHLSRTKAGGKRRPLATSLASSLALGVPTLCKCGGF